MESCFSDIKSPSIIDGGFSTAPIASGDHRLIPDALAVLVGAFQSDSSQRLGAEELSHNGDIFLCREFYCQIKQI